MRVSREGPLERLRKYLIAVWTSPTTAELGLVVLLLLALLLYLPLRLTFGSPQHLKTDAQAATEGLAVASLSLADVDPQGTLNLPTPPFVRPASGNHLERNPFAFQPKKTPRPTPRKKRPTPVKRRTPVPRATPRPTPTPVPYKQPFTLLGLAESLGTRIAFLKAEDSIYAAMEGQIVKVKQADGQFEEHRVKTITVDKVAIGPPDDSAEATLELKEAETGKRPAKASRRRRKR